MAILYNSSCIFWLMQIESCNKPFLSCLSEYDDGRDLSDYNFGQDGFGPPNDDENKRKLAYRHRVISQKYEKVRLFSPVHCSLPDRKPKAVIQWIFLCCKTIVKCA